MKYTVLYVEHRFPIPPGMRESKMVSPDRCGQPVGRSYEARTVLGWNPQKTTYAELVEIMAMHDRELAKREKVLKG